MNALESKVSALEKQYGSIDNIPKLELAKLQKFANDFAPSNGVYASKILKRVRSSEYKHYLASKLGRLKASELTLLEVTEILNSDDVITINGNRIFDQNEAANLLRYHRIHYKRVYKKKAEK